MTTARYLIKLTRTQDASCKTERRLTRDDRGRAVLYAQKWLLQTQRLSLYFGVTYDMYEIYKKDDNDQWVNVDTGSVLDAETGRAKAGTSSHQKDAGKMAPPKRRMASNKASRAGDDPRGDLFVTDKLPRSPKQRANRKTLTPLQQRFAEARAIALQVLADKRARGE